MNEKVLTLEEVHAGLLELLNEFNRICDELQIEYFLSGGSLIGAMRHKGFIPWDDDLDIMMLRSDYDKLIQNIDKLNPKYRLNCLETMTDWEYPFAKIDLPATYINDEYRTVQHGLFIDIFPIDKLPDNLDEQTKIAKKVKILDLLRGSGTKKKYRPTEKMKFVKNMIKPYANLRGPNYFARKIDQLARETNNSNQLSDTIGVMVVSTHGTKEFLSGNAFSEAIEVPFENTKSFIPHGYEEYLKNLYGDYMQMPPKEQQTPGHYKILMKIDK
ncbi:LicD family protein [Enterococcus dongliensis]|uniref:LicD family protein n=1 Tax=Enterococcus dongliensis TaxID=2559925 RepID=UPI00288EB41F|nr:LicD family protein [Enterococcus dongliensis]MDT2670807.1 LicD family protein [Enterococcus dongliensis]